MGLERDCMSDRIRRVLAERIIGGALAPGERLVEMRIAEEFRTSQAPVREALRELETLRLVESEPYRGTRVREVGEREMAEAYAVRAVLEQAAAEAAAPAQGERRGASPAAWPSSARPRPGRGPRGLRPARPRLPPADRRGRGQPDPAPDLGFAGLRDPGPDHARAQGPRPPAVARPTTRSSTPSRPATARPPAGSSASMPNRSGTSVPRSCTSR